MKKLIVAVCTVLVVLVGVSPSVNAQGCQPYRRNALGVVVAPFCDPYGRELARQRREQQGYVNVPRGYYRQGPTYRQAPQWIMPPRPPGGRYCVQGGVPGWCVN